MKFFLDILESKIFQNIVLPIIIVKATISADRKLVAREENKRIKISTFKLFIDIHTKIRDIQDFFISYNDETLKDIYVYSPGIINYTYEDIESYLVDISHRLEIIDLQVIRSFYINYQNLIEPLNKLASKRNMVLEVEKKKINILAFKDRDNYVRLEKMYTECIYKQKELEDTIYKLKNIIIQIENKEKKLISKLISYKGSKQKTFKDFKNIDINISIQELKDKNKDVYKYYRF